MIDISKYYIRFLINTVHDQLWCGLFAGKPYETGRIQFWMYCLVDENHLCLGNLSFPHEVWFIQKLSVWCKNPCVSYELKYRSLTKIYVSSIDNENIL